MSETSPMTVSATAAMVGERRGDPEYVRPQFIAGDFAATGPLDGDAILGWHPAAVAAYPIPNVLRKDGFDFLPSNLGGDRPYLFVDAPGQLGLRVVAALDGAE